MSDLSNRLELPFLAPSQAQKHVTHNEALQRLDAVTQLTVAEIDAVIPPAAPADGVIYALGPAPTGAWAGAAGQLAYWDGTGWLFITPDTGWRAWDAAQSVLRVYQGGAWQASDTASLQNLPGVGVGATSDATNRLSVAAAATLFSHDGAGHQVKVNKAASTETASLLYQSEFTGHAEMGLAGDTDFRIKVSGDGATWFDALRAEADTGRVVFPSGAVPAPQRAYISSEAAQLVPTGVDTYVAYDSADYDTDGFFDPANPDRLTIVEAGGYQLFTYVQVDPGIPVGQGYIILEQFDASGTRIGSFPASWVSGYTSHNTPMLQCAAGDYFRLLVRQNSGSDRTLWQTPRRNYLSIVRVF